MSKKIYSSLRMTLAMGLALASVSCASLEKAILNSEWIKQVIPPTANNFLTNFEKPYSIIDSRDISHKDPSSDEPSLLVIHGWGGNAYNWSYKPDGESLSPLDVMNEVFDGRVLLVNYPSGGSAKEMSSRIDAELLKFIKTYQENNLVEPKFVIFSHSLGTQFSRKEATEHPDYIKKVALVAGINDGIDFGWFTPLVKAKMPYYMGRVLTKNNKPSNLEMCQISLDTFHGSGFFNKDLNISNTSSEPLEVEYAFYSYASRPDGWFIPGDDDGVAPGFSSYPYRLIKEGKFEKVKVRGEIREGDVDHFTGVEDLEDLRKILTDLKSNEDDSLYSDSLQEPYKARCEIVSKCSEFERKMRETRKSQYDGDVMDLFN